MKFALTAAEGFETERTMAPRSDDDRGRDRDRDRDRDRGRDDRSRDRGGSRAERDDDDRGRRRDGSPRDGGSRREYEYAGRSSEENTQRAKQGSARYDSIFNEDLAYYSPKVGENCIRIIPWLNKKFPNYAELVEKYGNHWGVDAVIHRNVGADNGTYLCLDKMFGQPCPCCDIWREDDEEKLKPSDRILCFVIDRNEEKAGPQLWNMPLGTSKDIQAASQDRQTGEWYPVEHPDEGFDIYFDREGEKDRTRYKRFELAKKPSPLHDNERKMDQWLDYVMETPLPERLKSYDAEYIEKVLAGKRRDRDDRDDDDRDGGGRGSRRDRDRSRDDDRDSTRSSSRRRGDPDDEVDPSLTRPARRRGAEEDDAAGEFSRPSRRRGRDEDSPPGEEVDSRPSRGRREAAEDEPVGRSSRRGRASEDPEDPDDSEDPEPEKDTAADTRRPGGKTERYRTSGKTPSGDKDEGEDDDTGRARERLRRVGSRSRD
jgi:hypothetical protein